MRPWLAVMLLAVGCTPEKRPMPVALEVPKAAPRPDAPLPIVADDIADAGAPPEPHVRPKDAFVVKGKLTLPDGTTVKRASNKSMGLDGEHVEFVKGDGTSSAYSYIEPGDAELVLDEWVFARDVGTGIDRVWRHKMRTVDISHGGTATLRVGDRAKLGAGDDGWAIEWMSLAPGSGGHTGVRVMGLRSFRGGRPTDYWTYAPDVPAKKDLATVPALHHIEVEIVDAHFAPDAMDAYVTVRGREVDRAARASFGVPLAPGLYAFPDGLRLTWSKGQMCATSATNCRCYDTYSGAGELGGKEAYVELENGKTSRTLMHDFAIRNEKLIVTK